MSAFIVDDATIDVMLDSLKAVVSHIPHPMRLYWRDAHGDPRFFDNNNARDPHAMTDLGRLLLAQNARSVATRYRETHDPCAVLYTYRPTRRDIRLHPSSSSERTTRPTITANAALRNIACYEYQSCECDDWEHTEAYRFCAALKGRIASIALPAQDDDPWGFTDLDLGRSTPQPAIAHE